MKEVNADLYDFLNNHEAHICVINSRIESYVFIPFYDLENFVAMVGYDYLSDDGGVDCKLQDGNICIDVVDLIEYQGHLVSSYGKCFYEQEWRQHKEQILKLEVE